MVSGCGSSRPVPAARRKAWVSIKQPAPRTLQGSLEVAHQGRAGQRRAGAPAQQGSRAAGQLGRQAGERRRAGGQEAKQGHRSEETLDRGPRSEPRAPMQLVSGALGSLGMEEWGTIITTITTIPPIPTNQTKLLHQDLCNRLKV